MSFVQHKTCPVLPYDVTIMILNQFGYNTLDLNRLGSHTRMRSRVWGRITLIPLYCLRQPADVLHNLHFFYSCTHSVGTYHKTSNVFYIVLLSSYYWFAFAAIVLLIFPFTLSISKLWITWPWQNTLNIWCLNSPLHTLGLWRDTRPVDRVNVNYYHHYYLLLKTEKLRISINLNLS